MVDATEEWDELEACAWLWAEDTAAWFAKNLKIISRNNAVIPLVCNPEQMIVLYWIGMQIASGFPIRLMILKARRMGISTLITALLQMFVVTRRNYSAMAAAHDANGTNTMWEMAKLYRDSMEGTQYALPADRTNAKEIVYSKPHRSSYRFQTAGGQTGEGKAGIGRSKEITGAHFSERAFMQGWAAIIAGIASCIPDTPQSIRIDETTANGAHGAFYDDWHRTKASFDANPRNLYCTIPIFFSWLPRTDYSRAAPDGYEWDGLDDNEERLTALGATPEQLYWRRTRIAEQYSGDDELFAQEYPATPEEAFRASGSPAIPQGIISHHEKQIELAGEPRLVVLARVRDHRTIDHEGTVEITDLPDGTVYPRQADGSEPWYWRVWAEPREKHDYAIFGDVAEGLLADPANERSDLDSHTGAVLDRRELQYVASGDGRKVDPDVFGAELRMLAEWYNMAWVSPDATGVGAAALPPFTRPDGDLTPYSRLFQRVKGLDSIHEGEETALWGMKFTSGNRDHVIDAWLAACRSNPQRARNSRWEDSVSVTEPMLVSDERSFIRRKDGKREHAVNCHDDMLFAHMGAWWLHLYCPRDTIVKEEIPREPNASLRLGPPESYLGGVDSYTARHADDGEYEETV